MRHMFFVAARENKRQGPGRRNGWLLGALVVFVCAGSACDRRPETGLGSPRATPRILVLGDSWAQLVWNQRDIRNALERRGLGDFVEVGEETAIGGTTAADWAAPQNLPRITRALQEHPSVDIVHLSIGGNDFLQGGLALVTEAGRRELTARIVEDIEKIVDHIHGIRPQTRVLLVGYDFASAAMGPAPIPLQNSAITEFGRARLALARRKPGLDYAHNLGLMQATFGIKPDVTPGALSLPGGPPDYEPFPGGDPTRASPRAEFRDPAHLSEAGYRVLVERAADLFYVPWLR